jgi:hypothetical protein
LTIDYGEYLTDDVARKMHGRTVGVREDGHHMNDLKVAAPTDNNTPSAV